MISLYCWNNAQKAGMLLNPELLRTHTDRMKTGADVFWIDLHNPTKEEEDLVLEQFHPVHKLTREEIAKQRLGVEAIPDVPKAEEFPDYLFVVTNPLSVQLLEGVARKEKRTSFLADLERQVTQFSAILTSSALITHHIHDVPAVQNLWNFLAKHEEQAGRGPDYLFHLILDNMVDEYAPVLDHFQDWLDEIEEEVMDRPHRVLLHGILTLKRKIGQLRKSLVYQREVLARMMRGDFALIQEREIAYYRNVYDHMMRFTELIESSREMANDLMQTHMSVTSNKMNEIMKVLTMISTMVLPMTLVAGIYGMNFEILPEKDWRFGYPMSLCMMALTGIGAVSYFKWKKWL